MFTQEESGSLKCPQSTPIKRTQILQCLELQSFPILTCRTVDTPEIKQKHHLI